MQIKNKNKLQKNLLKNLVVSILFSIFVLLMRERNGSSKKDERVDSDLPI